MYTWYKYKYSYCYTHTKRRIISRLSDAVISGRFCVLLFVLYLLNYLINIKAFLLTQFDTQGFLKRYKFMSQSLKYKYEYSLTYLLPVQIYCISAVIGQDEDGLQLKVQLSSSSLL